MKLLLDYLDKHNIPYVEMAIKGDILIGTHPNTVSVSEREGRYDLQCHIPNSNIGLYQRDLNVFDAYNHMRRYLKRMGIMPFDNDDIVHSRRIKSSYCAPAFFDIKSFMLNEPELYQELVIDYPVDDGTHIIYVGNYE